MRPSLIEVSPIRLPDAKRIVAEKGKALRRAANRARSRAASAFRTLGIGRRVFGGTKTTSKVMKHLFAVGRLQDDGRTLAIDVTAKGLAAVQEEGGRIKPHDIHAESKGARNFLAKNPGQNLGRDEKRLAFVGRGGLIRPSVVHHPGGVMKRYSVIPKELETALSEVDRDVAAVLAEHL